MRVQSAICCGCDLPNCLQEKQKAKTIQLSPNNPTTATMTTTTTTKARNRLWPGAIYIARHFASSSCPDAAIVSGCASDSGSCSDSCRLLPHTSQLPALSLRWLLVCRSKVERSSNCLPGVFTAASGFFLSYLICDWAERANKLVAALSIECGKPPPAPLLPLFLSSSL